MWQTLSPGDLPVQVDLMEEAAALWKRWQGLPVCQAEAKLAEQAAQRASDACSAEQALYWRGAAARLQAAAELAVRPDCRCTGELPRCLNGLTQDDELVWVHSALAAISTSLYCQDFCSHARLVRGMLSIQACSETAANPGHLPAK